ncbi:MAG: SDR family NAD(P)-dependent oxidoreductase [Bacteroides sp.]|nr:SDR family NAD(P)-dependent oxidoreductase [Bacteroides sp.]
MTRSMKHVLITGGAGFIGSNVALKLIQKGFNVTVLDNLSPQIHGDNPEVTSPLYKSIKDKVNFIKGTVTSRDDWKKALEGVDAVLHLAAETGTGQSMYEIEKYVNVNIGGTAILLDILTNEKTNVKRVVVAESRAIYGEGRYWSEELNAFVYPDERPETSMSNGDFEVKYTGCDQPLKLVATTEESLIHPGSVYGITKQVQGQLVHLVCKSIGIESVSFRYQNVYGPGQSLSNPYTGILSIFSTRIKNGNGINIFEDGLETRDFVYIDDVVDATILGITTPEVSGHAFNIGTGVATDVLTVANTLKKYYGIDVPLTISGNYRLGDIRHNFADISKARALLGYEPKWSFERGIERFCKWVDSQPIQKDGYEKSIEEMKQKGLYK